MNKRELGGWYSKIGWKTNPFILDIQPHLIAGCREEIRELVKNINESQKYILITGPTGAGKTTVLKLISEMFSPVYLPKPPTQPEEFVGIIKGTILKPGVFDRLLKREQITIYNLADEINRKYNGKPVLFLVDEAHETNIAVLEWLRTIIDQIDGATVVIAGLPVFRETHLSRLETLKQRITLDLELNALGKDETIELIRKRIESVGGRNLEPFSYDTINEIYRRTGGFPREVIKMCNHLVHQAIERNSQAIDLSYFGKKEEIDAAIDAREVISSLTEKQRELVGIVSKTDGITPTELVRRMDLSDYKSGVHALRAINNILRRLEGLGVVSREKRGRSYKYIISPKVRSMMVDA